MFAAFRRCVVMPGFKWRKDGMLVEMECSSNTDQADSGGRVFQKAREKSTESRAHASASRCVAIERGDATATTRKNKKNVKRPAGVGATSQRSATYPTQARSSLGTDSSNKKKQNQSLALPCELRRPVPKISFR